MPLPPAVGILKLVYSGVFGALPWANIFHVNTDTFGELPQAELDQLATAYSDAWNLHWGTVVSTEVTLQQTTVTDLTSDTSLQAVNATQHSGAVPDASAAFSNGPVVSWKIPRRYRGGHPRTYLPSIGENIVNQYGVIDPGPIVTINNVAGAWQAAIEAAVTLQVTNPKLVCVHYVKGKLPQNPPLVDPVVGHSVNKIVGTQRRRIR